MIVLVLSKHFPSSMDHIRWEGLVSVVFMVCFTTSQALSVCGNVFENICILWAQSSDKPWVLWLLFNSVYVLSSESESLSRLEPLSRPVLIFRVWDIFNSCFSWLVEIVETSNLGFRLGIHLYSPKIHVVMDIFFDVSVCCKSCVGPHVLHMWPNVLVRFSKKNWACYQFGNDIMSRKNFHKFFEISTSNLSVFKLCSLGTLGTILDYIS